MDLRTGIFQSALFALLLVPGITTASNNGALKFQQSAASVDYRTCDGLDDFTVELWTNVVSNTTFGVFLSVARSDNDNLLLLHRDSTGKVGFQLLKDVQLFTGSNIPLNTWTHLAVVRRRDRMRLLINGVLVREVVSRAGRLSVPPNGVFLGYDQDCVGGCFNQPAHTLDGYIDEVRIWDVARSDQEIKADYANVLYNTNVSLRAYWRFEEGNGQTFLDSSGHGFHGVLGQTADTETLDPSWTSSTRTLADRIRRLSQSSPFPSKTADNLIFITHGWNSSADDWVLEMAKAIDRKIDSTWDIWTYDWREDASDPPLSRIGEEVEQADLVRRASENHGNPLGQHLLGLGYKHIHFIAHSAGSYVIETAAKLVRERDIIVTLHETFLDAFEYEPAGLSLGSSGDWSENFYNTGDLPATNGITGAYNMNVTHSQVDAGVLLACVATLPATLPECLAWEVAGLYAGHVWPYLWYMHTVNTMSAPGFGWSKESGQTLPSHDNFPRGALADLEVVHYVKALIPNGGFDSALDSWIFSSQGTIQAGPFVRNSSEVVAQLKAGSPVSLSKRITIPQGEYILGFEYAFPTGVGKLVVSVNSVEVLSIPAVSMFDDRLIPGAVIVSDPRIQGQSDVEVRFTFNGPTDALLLIDNVSFVTKDVRPYFIRGDSNADGIVDISDGVKVLLVLFAGEPPLSCEDAGDATDDGTVDISDSVRIFGYLFKGDAEPPFPGAVICGPDRTEANDELGCISAPACGKGVEEED